MVKIQELLSVNDFMQRLNENSSRPIGKNMVYSMLGEPDFPAMRIGSRWFVLGDKINEWLNKKAGLLIKNDEPAEENQSTNPKNN